MKKEQAKKIWRAKDGKKNKQQKERCRAEKELREN